MTDYLHIQLPPDQIRGISSIGLAHMGDAVYELLVRTWLCAHGKATGKGLHRATVALVCAPKQAELAQRIAARGRLQIDSIINNTNLAGETTPEMLRQGHQVVARAAEICGVDRVETCAMAEILAQCAELPNPMPMVRYMAPEWMEDA